MRRGRFPRSSARRPAAWALVATAALAPAAARANGRFPSAQFVVVGPGESSATVAVRATFGLVVSDDGGRTFRFLCEDLFQYPDGYDPAVALGADGTLLVGAPDGLRGALSRCAAQRRPELDGLGVVDLATDPTGRRVFAAAVTADQTPESRVFVSDDGGGRYTPTAGVLPGVVLDTVEVAPSNARRLYASGRAGAAGAAVVYRSDDGGASWRASDARFEGATGVFVSGVDPARADVVYARGAARGDGLDAGAADGASVLLRSDDGGATFREVGRTAGPMRGFALSGDGRTVWVGGPDARDGLLRSDGGGPFRRVGAATVDCLRWHAGALYACHPFAPAGPLLSRSTDGGATLEPLVRYRDVLGPPRCPAGTVAGDVCPARWPYVRAVIQPASRPDAAPADAPPDAPPDAPGDCDCDAGRAAHGAGAGAWLAAWAWAWAWALARRRVSAR